MIIHLDYEFNYKGDIFTGLHVNIGETIDIKREAEDVESLKISAICHSFNLTVGYDDAIKEILKNAIFTMCEVEE